jgi:2-oxoglutarate dehydrogenase E1 component
MFEEFGINAGYVEELHARYQQSPQSVDADWREFFDGRNGNGANGANANGALVVRPLPSIGKTNGNGAAAAVARATDGESLLAAAAMQGRVYQLLNAYRVRGHLFAHVDPLGAPPDAPQELALANFGLTADDLDRPFATAGMHGLPDRATLRQIIAHLAATYCGSIGVEYTHIEEPEPRQWLEERMESAQNRAKLDRSELVRILTKLTDAEIFEQFIHKNYVGAKRFSLEGAESMIPMIDLLIEAAGQHGVEEIVLGMAHRGRLNVLTNIMGKNPRELFAAFEDKQPERFLGSGDVKYHLGYSKDIVTGSGALVHLSLAFNPSHLEWVNPVVEGRVRAKQDRRKRKSTMPLLIHGDAAFMGQGVVPETLNMAKLEGYATGGTIHLIVNNQIGFTTIPKDARSTRYCSDIARMLRVPVFHVNGEDPEAVIQVTRLATECRERFATDVVIDMYCYRKYGHNEGDEPRFTQPVMYAKIDRKPTVREVYVQRLVDGGHVTREEADEIARARKAALDQALDEARKGDFHQMPETMGGVWKPFRGGPDKDVPEVPTGVAKEKLLELLEGLAKIPAGFHANAKALKVIEQRLERAKAGQTLDWGTAEHLAYASILSEGRGVRLSGQDARRGTFTHRHAVLFDNETGAHHIPLANLGPGAGRFEVYDSPLSEAGVLGFEYGYSLDRPEKLVLWEAQFGDFLNSAQVIVDQFIVSAEDKWSRLSGLVMLLPHGYEGQGPEHSSARVERFLTLAAEDNIQVCNLSTPAQFFHVLRRQVLRPLRKPLVVFTPKSWIRTPISTLDEIANGTFQRVIADDSVKAEDVRLILCCTGKVYYDLEKARRERGRKDVAILRIEQLYPLNDALKNALRPYEPGTPLRWVQEEPRNMGAWSFINVRRHDLIGERHPLSLASRPESASPATGSHSAHQLEQKMLIEDAFKD